jgi:adenylate cyclase
MAKKEGRFDLVKAVFERRLHQADMDRILAELSVGDRDELVAKMGALLDRISALVEVYNKISDTLSLDVLLPRLMAIVSEALRADRSTLFLNDPDHNELFSRVAQGDQIGEIRFPNERGIAGSVFRSGRAEIIPDAYQDVRFNPEVASRPGTAPATSCARRSGARAMSLAPHRSSTRRTASSTTRI